MNYSPAQWKFINLNYRNKILLNQNYSLKSLIRNMKLRKFQKKNQIQC